MGKILFIDDRYDEDIKKAISELVERGFTVQYWNGEEPLPETIRNVRVIVLDLDLAGLGARSGGIEDYSLAIEALHKIRGPYVVIIMAADFTDDDPRNLENYYKSLYGPICGYIAKEGLSKTEEAADPSRLRNILIKSINETLKLIFLWEAIVDKAKDTAMNELFGGEVEETIASLVKLLCLDVGQESAPREIVNYFMRLVLRRTREGIDFAQIRFLINKLSKAQRKGNYPTKDDLRLYYRLMFFKPDPAEKIWTGDIYRMTNTTSSMYDKYAIIMTPKCNIGLSKTSKIMVCYGFPLVEEYFDDPIFPPLKHDKKVVKRITNDKEKLRKWVEKRHPENLELLKKLIKNYPKLKNSEFHKAVSDKIEKMRQEFIKHMRKRYLDQSQLPDNLHILWNFEDVSAHPVCFDFNNINNIEKEEIQKGNRICRLDSPFIEDMLEKYGAFVSRVGVPCFNKSQNQLRILFK